MIAQTVTARTGQRYDPETETLIAFSSNRGHDDLRTDGVSPPIRVASGLGIPSPPAIAFRVDHHGANGVGVLTDGTAHTVGGSGEAVATNVVRRLTPLECERLQGFPDHWTAIPGNADYQRYRQLGNAVAVPVAEWIMRRIANAG